MRRLCVLVMVLAAAAVAAAEQQSVTRYVRYSLGGATSYGILEGDAIRELKGDLFASPAPTGRRVKLAEVKLLPPCVPSKVIAVGLNYKTHLGERPAAEYPGLFAKYPTSIIATEDNIVIPPDATNVHYEGEMVAKASDTFGPMGPAIVTGLNYDDLLLETKLNGEVVQSQRTKDLIFDVATIVSYLRRYVTLEPGDVIFSGTPGTTRAFKPGDTIEVVIEGIGTLRNRAVKGS